MADVEPVLRVETADASGSWLLGEPVVVFEDNMFRRVSMMIIDESLSAAADVQLSLMDEPPLDRFLVGLADSWQGWPGTRVWRALERHLELDARHDGSGHVTLGVTLKSRRHRRRVEDWCARTSLIIEAGEQMRQLAQDVKSLLDW